MFLVKELRVQTRVVVATPPGEPVGLTIIGTICEKKRSLLSAIILALKQWQF